MVRPPTTSDIDDSPRLVVPTAKGPAPITYHQLAVRRACLVLRGELKAFVGPGNHHVHRFMLWRQIGTFLQRCGLTGFLGPCRLDERVAGRVVVHGERQILVVRGQRCRARNIGQGDPPRINRGETTSTLCSSVDIDPRNIDGTEVVDVGVDP